MSVNQYKIELSSDLYGSEEFDYDSLQEAMDGFERLVQRCVEEYDRDGENRKLTLIIGD
jgi:hypothetical protein